MHWLATASTGVNTVGGVTVPAAAVQAAALVSVTRKFNADRFDSLYPKQQCGFDLSRSLRR